MARKQGGPPPSANRRPAATAAKGGAVAKTMAGGPVLTKGVVAKAPEAPRKRTSLVQFFNEVKAEARKVTWTSRRETWITSVMVFMMVVVTAVFFLIVDQVLGFGMHLLLNLAT
jgi:preprotein translocase subunit SecE